MIEVKGRHVDFEINGCKSRLWLEIIKPNPIHPQKPLYNLYYHSYTNQKTFCLCSFVKTLRTVNKYANMLGFEFVGDYE